MNQLASVGDVVLGVHSSNPASLNQVVIQTVHPGSAAAAKSMTVSITDVSGSAVSSVAASFTPDYFSPSTYGTVLAHLDASQISDAVGSSVTTWTDVGGNATSRTATSSSSSIAPVLTADANSGRNVLVFNGSSQEMSLANGITTARTIYLVFNTTAGISDYAFLFYYAAGSAYHFHGGVSTMFSSAYANGNLLNGVVNLDNANYSGSAAIGNISRPTNMSVMEIRASGNLSLDRIALGNTGARYWKGSFAEIIVFSDVVSSGDGLIIRCHLKNKWALTGSITGC